MKELTVFEAHSSYVLALLFTQDTKTLISAGMDNVIHLWSVPDWTLISSFEGHANSANSLSLSPNENILASGSSDQTVRLWSFPAGEPVHTLQDRKKTVSAVQISPDGAWVAAGSYGGRVMIWTLDGQDFLGIKASQKNLSSIAFSPDAKTLTTAGLGDDILVWSLPSGKQIATLSGHKTAAWSLRFIDQGTILTSLGYEGSVKFSHQLETPGVRGLTFSPDEKTAALSMESRVQLWSVKDWQMLSEIQISTKVVSSVAFSPNGSLLAIGGADNKIRIWEL